MLLVNEDTHRLAHRIVCGTGYSVKLTVTQVSVDLDVLSLLIVGFRLAEHGIEQHVNVAQAVLSSDSLRGIPYFLNKRCHSQLNNANTLLLIFFFAQIYPAVMDMFGTLPLT